VAVGTYAFLMEIDDIDEFAGILGALEIDPWDKKYICIQWCRIHGVALTRELLDAVGAA